MNPDIQRSVIAKTRSILDDAGLEEGERLYLALRYLAKYRSVLIDRDIRDMGGDQVRSGPFAGLQFPTDIAEGCRAPKLLGTYEEELHPVIERIATRGYRKIVNIGCAEGYYAVGFALRFPDAEIVAYDANPEACRMTAALAEAHSVGDRVTLSGAFAPADFQALPPGSTFIFCDIEGAETTLLNPVKAPNLATLDLLVELHDHIEAPASKSLTKAFEETHSIEVLELGSRNTRAIPELRQREHLDQLLAVWEWRAQPTPWLLLLADR